MKLTWGHIPIFHVPLDSNSNVGVPDGSWTAGVRVLLNPYFQVDCGVISTRAYILQGKIQRYQRQIFIEYQKTYVWVLKALISTGA